MSDRHGRHREPSDAITLEPVPLPAPAPGPRRERRPRPERASRRSKAGRPIAPLALVVIAVLLAIPVSVWAYYRLAYVVTRNAQVKGHITQVGAQLDGVVTNVNVYAGQRVHAGDELARFEDHQLRATLQRSQSRLEKASRELEVEQLAIQHEALRLGGSAQEAAARTEAARARVVAARSQADEAAAKFKQVQMLSERGLTSADELRTAESQQRTAAAQAATATADATAAAAGERVAGLDSDALVVRRRHLEVLQAEVEAANAEVSLAQADLNASIIRAPSDGWVVQRIAEAGASVVVGQPIVALWLGNELWVESWVGEDDLASIAPGHRARVTVRARPRHVYEGRVESVGMSTDAELSSSAVPQPRESRLRTTPVVCVRVRLDDPEGLFPGLSAVVGIQKKAR
jgi:membrane fusion protein (multidrug efflux system)